jgi:hypothetical protein
MNGQIAADREGAAGGRVQKVFMMDLMLHPTFAQAGGPRMSHGPNQTPRLAPVAYSGECIRVKGNPGEATMSTAPIPIRKPFFISSMSRCAATRWWAFCWRCFWAHSAFTTSICAAPGWEFFTAVSSGRALPAILGLIECFFMPGRVREFNAIQAAGIAAALGHSDARMGPADQCHREYAAAPGAGSGPISRARSWPAAMPAHQSRRRPLLRGGGTTL